MLPRTIVRCPRVRPRRIVVYSILCWAFFYLVFKFDSWQYLSPNATRPWPVIVFGGGAGTPQNGSTSLPHHVSAEWPKVTTPVHSRSVNGTPLPWCPMSPNITDVSFKLDLNETTHAKLVKEVGGAMQNGGHYLPVTCQSREHLAIIIPYRDRERNLHILLHNLLPFLWRQLIEFTVFLVEQTAEYPFNKGVLFNAAYRESQKMANFTCYIMQDTDLIPMDNRNLYRCGANPRHLCLTSGQTKWQTKLMYPLTFGGAIALRRKHIEAANGFSVSYYGWGLEDDDLIIRLRRKRFRIDRYAILTGKYYRLNHTKGTPNPKWTALRNSIVKRQGLEGLNTLNYTLLRHERTPLYTWLLIKVPPPPVSIYGKPFTTNTNTTTTTTTTTIQTNTTHSRSPAVG